MWVYMVNKFDKFAMVTEDSCQNYFQVWQQIA